MSFPSSSAFLSFFKANIYVCRHENYRLLRVWWALMWFTDSIFNVCDVEEIKWICDRATVSTKNTTKIYTCILNVYTILKCYPQSWINIKCPKFAIEAWCLTEHNMLLMHFGKGILLIRIHVPIVRTKVIYKWFQDVCSRVGN